MHPQLFIDTSTDQGLVALRRSPGHIDELLLHAGAQSSKELLPAVQTLLMRHGLKVGDLQQIVCGMGPGSFTGIRVALTVVTCLAFASRRPWVGFPSLMLWLPPTPGPYLAVLDARSGGVYAMAAHWEGTTGHLLTAPRRMSLEELETCAETLKIRRIVTPDVQKLTARLSGPWELLPAVPSTRWIWTAPTDFQQTTIHYG